MRLITPAQLAELSREPGCTCPVEDILLTSRHPETVTVCVCGKWEDALQGCDCIAPQRCQLRITSVLKQKPEEG